MRADKKTEIEIQLLNEVYIRSKKMVEDTDRGLLTFRPDRIEAQRKIIQHMEAAADVLDDHEKLIIEHEVLREKRKNWYKDYFSRSYYYDVRKKAFRNYLDCL